MGTSGESLESVDADEDFMDGGDGNDSESGSEIGFGGEADFNEGVPIEKYKALEMRLVAVVKKVKASRKEFKDMRRKFRKADRISKDVTKENEELNKEVVELDAKLQEVRRDESGRRLTLVASNTQPSRSLARCRRTRTRAQVAEEEVGEEEERAAPPSRSREGSREKRRGRPCFPEAPTTRMIIYFTSTCKI